jgi:hypothetical protein
MKSTLIANQRSTHSFDGLDFELLEDELEELLESFLAACL